MERLLVLVLTVFIGGLLWITVKAGRVNNYSSFYGYMLASLFAAGCANLDMVVCNRPYIPMASLPKLTAEITDCEPVLALDAGAYGLRIFRQFICEGERALRTRGVLAFEIGAGQVKLVQRLLQRNGSFQDIIQHPDDGGVVRVFSASKR